MDENASERGAGPFPGAAGASGFPEGEPARAFLSALTHPDPAVRERSQARVNRWRRVLAGMADGSPAIGSRTPVRGLPAWVTLEVLRGGLVTGRPAAGGPLLPHEADAARRAGVPAERGALFAYHLTGPGLAGLNRLLASGAYEVRFPEEAALLTVAWLAGHGDTAGALELLDLLAPFADRLCFTPRPATAPPPVPGQVSRLTVGQAREAVAAHRPNPAVEAMNEALTVWNPFADQLLDHWLATARGGRVLAQPPDAAWHAHAARLLARYRELAAEHTRCRKHLNPKENLAVLRDAMETTVAGRPLDARTAGLLRHAVAAMVRRRGAPGTPRHTALRARQAADAARPTHHALAQVVARRLSGLPQNTGTPDAEALTGPVTAAEHRATGVPEGAAIPEGVARAVRGTLTATPGTLVERGVVPSAEVLAQVIPQLVAPATAAAYPDPALRRLITAASTAFRNRHSVLLLDLRRQVRFDELPWVAAVSAHRASGAGARRATAALLRETAELALQTWPGTLLPNRLIGELGILAAEGDTPLPLVEELAADIFAGTFTPKYLAAAHVAGRLLHGTLYAAYYGIDYAALPPLPPGDPGRTGRRDVPAFAALCQARAGVTRTGHRSPEENGMVIEQAQILTTHNLATLAGPVGARPQPGWADLARRAFATVCGLTARVEGNPRPLPAVKDAAYAWRHTLFHLSLASPGEQTATVAWIRRELARRPRHVRFRLEPVVAGLRLVREGGAFGPDGTALDGRARRFTGWSLRHWMLASPPPGALGPA